MIKYIIAILIGVIIGVGFHIFQSFVDLAASYDKTMDDYFDGWEDK